MILLVACPCGSPPRYRRFSTSSWFPLMETEFGFEASAANESERRLTSALTWNGPITVQQSQKAPTRFYVGATSDGGLTVCHWPSLTVTGEVMEAGPLPRSADSVSFPPVSLRTTKSICLASERRRIIPSGTLLRTDNLTDRLRRTRPGSLPPGRDGVQQSSAHMQMLTFF